MHWDIILIDIIIIPLPHYKRQTKQNNKTIILSMYVKLCSTQHIHVILSYLQKNTEEKHALREIRMLSTCPITQTSVCVSTHQNPHNITTLPYLCHFVHCSLGKCWLGHPEIQVVIPSWLLSCCWNCWLWYGLSKTAPLPSLPDPGTHSRPCWWSYGHRSHFQGRWHWNTLLDTGIAGLCSLLGMCKWRSPPENWHKCHQTDKDL